MMYTPHEWQILEALGELQRRKDYHKYGPTPAAIATWIEAHYGPGCRNTQAVCFTMEGGALFRTVTFGRPMYHHFAIHPDYYPQEPIHDPYTEDEREELRRILHERGEREKKERELREERAREKQERLKDERRRMRARARARAALRPADEAGDCEVICCNDLDVSELERLIKEDPRSVLILDTETTGLDSIEDDILEIAIISAAGDVLLNERYNSWRTSWPEAQRINHISPADVADLPTAETAAERMSEIIAQARAIVGYNLEFDLNFMHSTGVRFPQGMRYCDIMVQFAEFYGDWAEWAEDWKWQKLTSAAAYYKISTAGAHGALRDSMMTLGVARRLAQEPEEERHRPS